MLEPLPLLRSTLDFMPSPLADRPGLVIRDPIYSDATLVIPPALVSCLELFDGKHSRSELREALVRLSGSLDVSELESHLLKTISEAGFFFDDKYDRMATDRLTEFRNDPKRPPSHSGTSYASDPEELHRTLARYIAAVPAGAPPVHKNIFGIAVNHMTPELSQEGYGAAYRCLGPELEDRTFIILATSHYGISQHFGLTRKSYITPLGETSVDIPLVDWLEKKAFQAAIIEDYCARMEHSAEFQVVFLQHLYGPHIRIIPILCGSFHPSMCEGGFPEDDPGVAQFFDALGELAAREGDRLFWVLSGLASHMGRHYGDTFVALANNGKMLEVEISDRKRIDRILANDAAGLWELCRENQDPQKWTLTLPAYTFMKAVPEARGRLEYYGQKQFDEQSVVTHAALSFWRE